MTDAGVVVVIAWATGQSPSVALTKPDTDEDSLSFVGHEFLVSDQSKSVY